MSHHPNKNDAKISQLRIFNDVIISHIYIQCNFAEAFNKNKGYEHTYYKGSNEEKGANNLRPRQKTRRYARNNTASNPRNPQH